MKGWYNVALCLVCLLLFVGVVDAYVQNFQNTIDDVTIGGYSAYLTTGTFSDDIVVMLSSDYCTAAYAKSTVPTATNYWAVSILKFYQGNCGGGPTHVVANMYDVGNSFIGAVDLAGDGGGWTSGPAKRIRIEKSGTAYSVYHNGVLYKTTTLAATQPYYVSISVELNGWATIDDLVVGATQTEVVGCPPHTWFVGKDMIDPTIKGLFDNAYNNVNTTSFHYTQSGGSSCSVNTYDVSSPPTSGRITITYGSASDYIDCKSVVLSGNTIGFDNSTYLLGDTTKINWTVATVYWLPTTYTYKINVYKFDVTTSESTLDTTISVSASSGTDQPYIPGSVGYYYSALMCSPISSPTSEYTLAYSDLISVENGIMVSGTTYDGFSELPLSGVSIGIKQGGTWHNVTNTSASDGTWSSNYTFLTGSKIDFYGSKTGYQTATFNYTWTSPIHANIDLVLLPNFLVLPNATPVIGHNGTALGGFVMDSSGTKLSGATVSCSGGSWVTPPSGIWLLDDLTANSVYNVTASLSGYVPLYRSLSTGDAGTIMYYNFIFGPTNGSITSSSIGGYTIDAPSAYPLQSTTLNLSNASVPTNIATSSSGGYYQYGSLLPLSGYTLSAAKTGYVSQSTSVTSGAASSISYYNFFMIPTSLSNSSGAALAGFISDASTFAAITGATVSLSNGTSVSSTSPYGAYLFDGVSDTTTYTITASASGYTTQSKTVTSLISPGVVFTNFYLASNTSTTVNGTTIYGLVTASPFNIPVDGATITCTGQNSTTSNSVGFYKFENLNPVTSYTLSASASGYTTGSDATKSKTTGSSNTAVQQDLILSQTFLVNVDVRDYTSNALIQSNVSVTVNDADEQTTVGGKTSYYLEYGTYTFAGTCEGYYAGSTSATIANAQTVTIYMYDIPDNTTSPGSGRQYAANEVQFTFMDRYGRDLQGVSINATPINSTMPSNWMSEWLGINIVTNPPNSTSMDGITDYHGQVVFIMVKEQLYKLTCRDASQGINQTFYMYPSQSMYLYTLNTTATNLTAPITGVISYTLTNTTINSTHSNLTMYYIDSAASTTNLSFWVKSHNSPLEYVCQTYVPCTSGCSAGCSAAYTCPYSGGTDYTYGFTAVSSTYGTVSHSTTVTYEKLIDLGIPEAYYPWIAAIFLFLLAGFFSIISVRFAAVIIPAIAYLFFMMKWITLGPNTAIILGVLFAIGILSYMRKQEDRVS